MDVLEWLKEQKCPWSEVAYVDAISFYDSALEVLEWLKENGCPLDKSLLREKAESNYSSKVVSWLDQLP